MTSTSSATNRTGVSPQETAHELFRIQKSCKLLYDPRQHDYTMIRDRRKEVAEISKRFPPTVREKRLFTQHLVWSYAFLWLPQDEKEKNAHWWGPILETFATDYGETNTVGFAEALLVQDGWERVLVQANSYASNDGSDHGFQVFHLDPNYSYLAH